MRKMLRVRLKVREGWRWSPLRELGGTDFMQILGVILREVRLREERHRVLRRMKRMRMRMMNRRGMLRVSLVELGVVEMGWRIPVGDEWVPRLWGRRV